MFGLSKVAGMLDIDNPLHVRFDAADEIGLREVVLVLEKVFFQ